MAAIVQLCRPFPEPLVVWLTDEVDANRKRVVRAHNNICKWTRRELLGCAMRSWKWACARPFYYDTSSDDDLHYDGELYSTDEVTTAESSSDF